MSAETSSQPADNVKIQATDQAASQPGEMSEDQLDEVSGGKRAINPVDLLEMTR